MYSIDEIQGLTVLFLMLFISDSIRLLMYPESGFAFDNNWTIYGTFHPEYDHFQHFMKFGEDIYKNFNLTFLFTIRTCAQILFLGLLLRHDLGAKKAWKEAYSTFNHPKVLIFTIIRGFFSYLRALLLHAFITSSIPNFLNLMFQTLVLTVATLSENNAPAKSHVIIDARSIILCWVLWYYGVTLTINFLAASLLLISYIFGALILLGPIEFIIHVLKIIIKVLDCAASFILNEKSYLRHYFLDDFG